MDAHECNGPAIRYQVPLWASFVRMPVSGVIHDASLIVVADEDRFPV